MTASSASWKREPFTDGVPLTYRATFSDAEFLRLQNGLVPEQMEDKWFVYYETPYLFFHRSWTGLAVFRVALELSTGGAFVMEALWAAELANAANADPEYQSKMLAFLVSNLLLGQSKPFPRPENVKESVPGAFQHHVSGSGFRESVVKPKKPWWRVW
jgi:hypothetical protein